MLEKLSLSVKDIKKYRSVLGSEVIDEVEKLARDLKGIRLCHINSTPFGGGVAELLFSHIPLMRGAGIDADWQVIRGDQRFFTITKSLHNALQGAEYPLIMEDKTKRVYLANNEMNARELDPNYDVFIVNDPQPAALRHFSNTTQAKWVWRCHIDSSEPDNDTWQFLRPYIEEYDAVVFTMGKFVPQDLKCPLIAIMAPAIDPFSPKNMPLPRALCRQMVDNLNIHRRQPLIVQVSRFDPWKDPFGVMEVYRLVKKEVPGVQLALIGSIANDDPEGWGLFTAVNKEANKDEDIHVFSNLTGVGNMEVNAFQTASDVVIQKSIKEGFGLVIAEALWKERPVVAGNAGGIPLQMTGELSNYLVSTIEECAEKVIKLLKDPDLAEKLGQEGREHIKNNFLMPRLVRDELRLIKSLVAT